MMKENESEDWRLTNQKVYLDNKVLIRRKYANKVTENQHDHCEFCLGTFGYDINSDEESYCTEDEYRWICSECYNDFKNIFNWNILDK